MKTKMGYNSTTNQKIKEKFVEREVLTCFSYEMDRILSQSQEHALKNVPNYDDINNGYDKVCPNCNEIINYEGQGNCPVCNSEILDKDIEQQPKEIYEWWIVTEFLYKKLIAYGQAGLEWGNNYYWGRETTGQSISLDHVISII